MFTFLAVGMTVIMCRTRWPGLGDAWRDGDTVEFSITPSVCNLFTNDSGILFTIEYGALCIRHFACMAFIRHCSWLSASTFSHWWYLELPKYKYVVRLLQEVKLLYFKNDCMIVLYTCMTTFSFYHPFFYIIFLNYIHLSRNVCTSCMCVTFTLYFVYIYKDFCPK